MSDANESHASWHMMLVEAFAVANLVFLSVDIYVAHKINDFAHSAEWIPVGFCIAALPLLPGVWRRRYRSGVSYFAGVAVGTAAILLGIVGMVYHLRGEFFQEQTLHALVYSAPFIAPLSYAGVGLLLLLNRLETNGSRAWGGWVVMLAMGGFVGNLVLSLLDHAQNGFFNELEWIPVIAAAFAVAFLLIAVLRESSDSFLKLCMYVMVAQCVVGMIGFVLHLEANLDAPGETLRAKFIFGAPIFAPLLFSNLAILAVVGLWEMMCDAESSDSEQL